MIFIHPDFYEGVGPLSPMEYADRRLNQLSVLDAHCFYRALPITV